MLQYLWEWFADLSMGVAPTGMAPVQVTWADVDAWARLTGEEPEPWEARALVTLGLRRAAIAADKIAAERKR